MPLLVEERSLVVAADGDVLLLCLRQKPGEAGEKVSLQGDDFSPVALYPQREKKGAW